MKCRKWFRSAVACALAAGLVAGLGGCETETPLSSAGAESGAESAAAIKLKYTPPISIDQAIYNIGMCVTDLGSQSVSKETFAKRCQLYKDFGLVTIRTGTLWGDVERKEGEFLPPPTSSTCTASGRTACGLSSSLGPFRLSPTGIWPNIRTP